MVKRLSLIVAACSVLASTGCAGPIERWIVDTRVHQGEVALARGNVQDAELSYRLALRVDPADQRARAGYVDASAELAQLDYTKGQFDDALSALNEAAKYDPASVRLQGLRATIEEARLKREIVVSNYPTYREAGVTIARAYQQLDVSNRALLTAIQRFSYTYNSDDLTDAIKKSYDLQLDLARNTNRLIAYRQLVESGAPREPGTSEGTSTAGSLLPLP